MSTDLGHSDLSAKIDVLTAAVRQLSGAYEDIVAWNIAEKAKKYLVRGIVVWASAATVLLGVLGWRGWDDIVRKGTESGRQAAKDKFDAVYEREYKQAALRSLSKMDVDLAKAVAESREEMNGQLELLAREVSIATEKPAIAASLALELKKPPKALTAYAYYGIATGTTSWAERNFSNASRGDDEAPVVGNIVRALVPVNGRASVIAYDPQRGWVNGPIKGAVQVGERLRVREIATVADNYVWIGFERE